jgi:hydroxymethylpyrimidine pyrophosphatase-like HAD family hydrolase
LAEQLGLTAANVMAIGDQGNDLSMIEYAGTGVAMGNAIDSVKTAAQHITTDNDHDGVAQAIEKLALN